MRKSLLRQPLQLEGEWLLSWSKFVRQGFPTDSSKLKSIKVPGAWSNNVNKSLGLPPRGFATYHLTILLPKHHSKGLLLRIGRVYSAYELWVNNRRLASVGELGTQPKQGRMELREVTVSLPAAPILHLNVLVSNYRHRMGGLRRNWSIGRPQPLLSSLQARDLLSGLLPSVIFAVGCFFLAIGGVRREVAWLWFAAFCMATALRSSLSNDAFLFRQVLPWLDTTALLRTEYMSIYGIGVTLLGSFAYSFPKQSPWRVVHLLMGITVVFIPASALMPLSWVLGSLPLFGLLSIASLSIVLWITAQAWFQHERLAGAILLSLVIALLAFTHDVVQALGFVPTKMELAPLSFILFVFVQTYAMALRFAESYDHIKELSEELQEAHTKLQEKHKATLQELEEFRQMGNYQLEELLGSGGMGEVWRASHRLLARPAAIKLILPEMYMKSDDQGLQRFEREAIVIAQLRSPHTVELYDFGESPEGELYYAMELLQGLDLERMIKHHGAMPPGRVIHILKQACLSLAEAHGVGLVHRDIKPANLFLCQMGHQFDFVKVLDFGLVKALQPEVSPTEDALDAVKEEPTKTVKTPFPTANFERAPLKTPSSNRAVISGEIQQPLTLIGTITGTPAFMAPEQINNDLISGAVDLYALGCIGYWLLTARNVFESTNTFSLLSQHILAEPTPIQDVSMQNIPDGLQQLIHQCLNKKPEDRPLSASSMYDTLDSLSQEYPWTHQEARQWWEEHGDMIDNTSTQEALLTTQLSIRAKF